MIARFHRAVAASRVAAQPCLAANCSCPRRVAKTPPGPTTPFARQVAASRAPLLRMRFLWTGYLSARHDFWPRPLSVGTHPTVTTCKANTGRTPRFLRFTEPSDKCGVGQLVICACLPTNPVQMTSPGPSRARGGSGRSLTGATERPMAFKWTKASRAKLSRSQKARWKERKRQQRRKRAKRSS